MDNLVIMKNQQAVTTSLQVAETFNKNHRDVLAAIDDLKEGVAENYADLFYEDSYIHPQNKQKYRQIIMNRDGFTLLAMGFTGQKALKFKLKYIEAFNQMEELLKTQSNLPMNNTELLLEAALKHERGLTLVNQRLDKLETETTINRSQQRKIQGLVSSTVIKVLGGKKTSAYKTVLRNMLSKWGILPIEMQEATTSDEKVQQMQEDGNIISETEVEENTTMKTAEVINEADSDSLNQTDLFDTKNPPLE